MTTRTDRRSFIKTMGLTATASVTGLGGLTAAANSSSPEVNCQSVLINVMPS